jgi:large repetitive protein
MAKQKLILGIFLSFILLAISNPALADFCDDDGDGHDSASLCGGDDCDDTDASVNPDEAESCDGVDNDCNGLVDDGLATSTYYADVDGDTYGDATDSEVDCAAPTGYVADDTDCDDTDSAINTDATEDCDSVDNNCDGTIDEGCGSSTFCDSDADGYDSASLCGGTDCDDSDAAINKAATEICDDIDNDCDGLVDDGLPTATYYADVDGDTYGDATDSEVDCAMPTGYVADDTDCDDTDIAVNTAATEACDSIDNNCDGTIDEGCGSATFCDADADGFDSASLCGGTDCDDSDSAVNPSVVESCDDVDNDCNGLVDDGLPTSTYYADVDGDTYGDVTDSEVDCAMPSGYVADDTDCDDTDIAINTAATEACDGIDNNCDGTIDEGCGTTTFCDSDGDGYDSASLCGGTDCDDADSAVNPGAVESCDLADNDCNGLVDDGLTTYTYYADVDGDTYGDVTDTEIDCAAPAGYVADDSDCDDTDSAINATAIETCDGVDNNCDGAVDEGCATFCDADADGYDSASLCGGTDCDDSDSAVNPSAVESCDAVDNDCNGLVDDGLTVITYYVDSDTDGYGDATSATIDDCAQPAGYVEDSSDCDDTDAAINPDATEICDAVDNDCDGTIDGPTSDDARTWHPDIDGDHHGDSGFSLLRCSRPPGFVLKDTDCDDSDAAVNPDADEVCGDGIDNNCEGTIDGSEAIDALTWYADADGDSYGDVDETTLDCNQPTGYVSYELDCDDSDYSVNPAAEDECDDAIDNDCNGQVDEGCVAETETDLDGDGYSTAEGDCDDNNVAVYPDASEICDGLDNDCNGDRDDDDAWVDLGTAFTWYIDEDDDGYGSAEESTLACANPGGYALNTSDCYDDDETAYPGADEICSDGLDNDCDGEEDESDCEVLDTDADVVDDDDGGVAGALSGGSGATSGCSLNTAALPSQSMAIYLLMILLIVGRIFNPFSKQ